MAAVIRSHEASPDCWCGPELDEHGVYVHRMVNMSETTEPETDDRSAEHLRVISGRWAYLSQIVIAKESTGYDTAWDRAELAALQWVLEKLDPPDEADTGNAAAEGADA